MVDDYVIDNQWIPVGAAPVKNWVREVAVDSNTLPGSSSFESIHSSTWKRLQTFTLGSVVEFDGKFGNLKSQITLITNHQTVVGSGANCLRSIRLKERIGLLNPRNHLTDSITSPRMDNSLTIKLMPRSTLGVF